MPKNICSFAFALSQPTVEDALFQRGGYYVKDLSGTKRDRYRYGIFLGDSMLAATGQLLKAKRTVNRLYRDHPFNIDLGQLNKKQRDEIEATLNKLKRRDGLKLRDDYRKRQMRKPKNLKKFGSKKRGIAFAEEIQNRLQAIQDRIKRATTITKLQKLRTSVEDTLLEMSQNEALYISPGEKQLNEEKAANVIIKIMDAIAARRRTDKPKKAKPENRLSASQVNDLLRDGITCTRDPQTVVNELKEAEQTKKVIEAIEILENTRCR